ncbi:MAG: RlmE family RNA methyltransferase [Parvibaculum sp.]|uniref:RlmE family RNA methyltransferase n=1 Tax=Parvibaculum sp. TaxID=2024848 RepID=UPI001DA7B319|nr:RlmE family RNA methyltransferase [Parvibaculum sp.]MBX3491014.1 RlmE family RNA methyltransferase [Parvibaculum sp.]MBX3497547.1 RlmE family RNA methyltransferase [Parvibaculum sp.]MCW5728833.1 RlmE family RNA methyltransferase [Parvibaculum sp.]
MAAGDKTGKGGKGAGSGARTLKVRVKTARRRSNSSTRWLQRQLNDPYVHAAKREGYRSRAAFKLAEIDDKYRFLKPGGRVVDLGCAPGGWSQVAVARVNAQGTAGNRQGRVIGLDYLEMDPVPGATILQLDFLDEGADTRVKELLAGEADVVLSDMAAPTTGHKQTDHMRIMSLCEIAAQFAVEVLAPGGTFLAKVLRGGTENELLVLLKRHFQTVRHVKPKASRADSAEMYVLAQGFKGRSASDSADAE